MMDPLQMMSKSQILQTHQNYVVWPHLPMPYPPENTAVFSQLPSFNFHPPPPSNPPGRVNWRLNKPDNRKEFRRCDSLPANSTPSIAKRSGGNARRFYYQRRKFSGARLAAPFAPRNTTSFIIRSKKSGGIASLVSPCPLTPAILPTPTLSPSTEVVVETAKEEWGVDGYGSMKGLIRLRSEKEDPGYTEMDDGDDGEHMEVEKRLAHDLSRFEMIYPNSGGDENSLENRVDEQGNQIAHLEEENLTLKGRIVVMERELSELKRRVLFLENPPQGDDHSGDVCSENSIGNGDNGGDNNRD